MTTIAQNINLSPVNIEERKSLQFKSGDILKVDTKVKEGKDKFRIQSFECLCLARKHGVQPGATFTVRKMSGDIAVERIFPLYSPAIDKIKVVRSNRARKSKIYFVRTKAAKETRKKLKAIAIKKLQVETAA